MAAAVDWHSVGGIVPPPAPAQFHLIRCIPTAPCPSAIFVCAWNTASYRHRVDLFSQLTTAASPHPPAEKRLPSPFSALHFRNGDSSGTFTSDHFARATSCPRPPAAPNQPNCGRSSLCIHCVIIASPSANESFVYYRGAPAPNTSIDIYGPSCCTSPPRDANQTPTPLSAALTWRGHRL